MIDLKQLEACPEDIVNNLARRGVHLDVDHILAQLQQIKATKQAIEGINVRANKHEALETDKQDGKRLKEQLAGLNFATNQILHLIPNLLHPTVPDGYGAEANVEIEVHGNVHKAAEDYLTVAARHGLDMPAGADLAQARFAVMGGKVARLHRTLLNRALDHYGEAGYEEFYVPNIVNQQTMFGTGQYPKFKEELFTLTRDDGEPLFLIPTGEVPLTNLFHEKTLDVEFAEQKLMTHTPCFRKEAGAYGKDTRGIIRQHQFEKVELVRTCLPENGLATLEAMLDDVRGFVGDLGLRWRVIELCAGDIGFAGHKAYDVEVWFAHEERWREIATITWCLDFQARRMRAQVKDGKNKQFLHTLNGTGLAVGRVMAALLEQYGEEAFNRFM